MSHFTIPTDYSYSDEEIFQELKSPPDTSSDLVYRKPQKSADFDGNGCLLRRVFNFERFISVSPKKITRYEKNTAPNKGYSIDAMVSMGWEVNDLGVWSKPSVKLTDTGAVTEDNRSHGLFSSKSNAAINLAIDWMILTATNSEGKFKDKEDLNQSTGNFFKWKLNFVTLTLSSKQVHSDKFIKKKMLGAFLDYLRKKKGVKNYIWRAESQNTSSANNGNIHFHIILDKWIPWKELRDVWNDIQNNSGYIDPFELKFKHRNPNSTDIHSLKNIANVGAYLSKYCSKNSKGITILSSQVKLVNPKLPFLFIWNEWNTPTSCLKKNNKKNKTQHTSIKFYRQIHGRLWGLSEQLSKLKKFRIKVDDAISEELMSFSQKYSQKIIDFDYCKQFIVEAKDLVKHGLQHIRNLFATHVSNILNPVKQLNIIPI